MGPAQMAVCEVPVQVREINPRCHATSVLRRHSKIYDDLWGYRKSYATFVNIHESRSFEKQKNR